jgi:alpha-methylacyl-CoA racemase
LQHPHHTARQVFLPRAAGLPPELRPTPRLSATPGTPGASPRWPGADTDDVLAEAGFAAEEVRRLREAGAIA